MTHVYFLFQAEDGIRDRNVTGVQTCALPISSRSRTPPARRSSRWGGSRPPRGSRRAPGRDRKSVVEGKSVDLGGRRISKKKIDVASHSQMDNIRCGRRGATSI